MVDRVRDGTAETSGFGQENHPGWRFFLEICFSKFEKLKILEEIFN